jgi:hypothetical protein
MKFCSKCGHELVDEAVVCINCGCSVSPAYQQATKAKNASTVTLGTPTTEKTSVLPCVFNFVFSITAVVSVFFLILSVAWAWISTDIYTSYYSSNISVYAYLYPDAWFAILGLISAIVSCGFGIVSFILALVKKEKLDKLFSSITRLFIGVALIVLSICIGMQGW